MKNADPDKTRGERQAFIMRQSKSARAIGLDRREFVETYGDIDYVPRDVDMDPPVVQHTVTILRNDIETKRMNPLLKRVGLLVFDKVFSPKLTQGIQKWRDVVYYWKSFADLFKIKGKRVMGKKVRPVGKRRMRIAPDPRDDVSTPNFLRSEKRKQTESLQKYIKESIIDECETCGFPSRTCPVCEISESNISFKDVSGKKPRTMAANAPVGVPRAVWEVIDDIESIRDADLRGLLGLEVYQIIKHLRTAPKKEREFDRVQWNEVDLEPVYEEDPDFPNAGSEDLFLDKKTGLRVIKEFDGNLFREIPHPPGAVTVMDLARFSAALWAASHRVVEFGEREPDRLSQEQRQEAVDKIVENADFVESIVLLLTTKDQGEVFKSIVDMLKRKEEQNLRVVEGKKKKRKKKKKKTGIGWGNTNSPGASEIGNIASPGE